MTAEERALYSLAFRREMHARGLILEPDDDGVTLLMRLGDSLQAFFGKAMVFGACVFFGGFVGALVGSVEGGCLLGLVAAALGLLSFERRPPLGPLGRRINALNIALGFPPYDARFSSSTQAVVLIVFAVAFWAGLGALLGLLFGVPLLGAVLAGGVTLFQCFKAVAWPVADYDPETYDHGNVEGEADVTRDLAQIKQAGLVASPEIDGGGFFIGTYGTQQWEKA